MTVSNYSVLTVCGCILKKCVFPFKEGLVSLWDESEKPFNNEASTSSKKQEQFVEDLWYRVMDDILVVGVKLVKSFEL